METVVSARLLELSYINASQDLITFNTSMAVGGWRAALQLLEERTATIGEPVWVLENGAKEASHVRGTASSSWPRSP